VDNRKPAKHDQIDEAIDYKKIAKAVIHFVETSRFNLLETLAEELATFLLKRFPIPALHLRVSKPGAIRGSRNVGVDITRECPNESEGSIYLGLGSNV
jgi:dihydroneopterin aldolase